MMRILVLDHYFDQDIAALRVAGEGQFELRTIPFGLLRNEALRVFPEEVATGLEAFAEPRLEPERRKWQQRTVELFEEQFSIREFDAFVSPSDVFFYVRGAPEACHRLGVPFFVTQKETTIAPDAMQSNSQIIRTYAPPIADHMTVCSELHREFWLRAGADPETVTVTGQPRFDYYAQVGSDRVEMGFGQGGPVVLFFSYQLDTYHPEYGTGQPVWTDLHHQTEEGLWALVERGWRVLIKPHPQQDWEPDRRRIKRRLGSLSGSRVFLLEPDDDARKLIAASDVVIGFQSTALLECMIAGRPVVYTDWDPESRRLRSGLLPFHEWGDVVSLVDSAEALPDAVEHAARSAGGAGTERAREIAIHYLGAIDGRASRRTLEVIRELIERFEGARSAEVAGHRAEVARRRPPLALGRRAREGLGGIRARLARAVPH